MIKTALARVSNALFGPSLKQDVYSLALIQAQQNFRSAALADHPTIENVQKTGLDVIRLAPYAQPTTALEAYVDVANFASQTRLHSWGCNTRDITDHLTRQAIYGIVRLAPQMIQSHSGLAVAALSLATERTYHMSDPHGESPALHRKAQALYTEAQAVHDAHLQSRKEPSRTAPPCVPGNAGANPRAV